ncbi:PREDICTED: protein trapped in endoderm-1 [Vollenhovia emeryi]|uniref:protein trapped in endoderm-1 n=1 Tax=Vollenhovia emeryi TaxID=411798 RepID=UPI0005F38F35|nr:PREDICTED: protein trapped in endoderm-1 [Vollenhovia emeryi]XP_011868595.1 PREDICTED: protein trapped in endoderm-1 [Vollenhovia emeryi]XP_011868596.1 PREDICTED: protein trapped in endoderm-1 [Vollenhovia emeryi]XP_011868597.1 PREDICTED: protein trapped in endoderm-1 [Vollenhovia emeryi]XP_011868598.1 PREDICTED: protein trapped in endoderm-1 [Vollenhovia emeryi]XP_011868599.1 PREDICTED: protein trapped in endoderm-1 [Vollenhovia emeryi]XP_011868601.1 PREDICTED: protein trapped in endoderm
MGHFAANNTIYEIASGDGDFKPFARSVTIVAAACAIIFSIIGVLGNLITVIALLKYTRLRRHATTAFVISLSISDLIFSAVNLPLTASRYLNEAWVLGETLCKIFPLFFYGNVAVSLLSMVAITINRYILISQSDIYSQLYTSRGITLMLIVIWTLSFLMLLPPLLGIWGTLGLDSATFSCTILRKNGSSPKKFLFVLGFIVPCVVISVSYLCIYWRVRQSRKNLEAHAAESGRRSGGFQRREDSRVTRLMLTIFLCFLMCFMPLMLVNVIDDKMKVPILHVVASVLAWASAVVNPFIYAGTNKLYREAYKQVLCPVSSRTPTIGPKPTHSHSSKILSPHTI